MNKKYFIYVIYVLMGGLDFSFSKNLGFEMMMFTIILLAIKLYSVYVSSITTLIITSLLSIFLFYNNSNTNYQYNYDASKNSAQSRLIIEEGIKNLDNQISKYWFAGDVLLQLQNQRADLLNQLSKLNTSSNKQLINPWLLLMTNITIYLCLVILVYQIKAPVKKDSINIVDNLKDKLPKEKLVLEAKALSLHDFKEKYGYNKSQYYNFRKQYI